MQLLFDLQQPPIDTVTSVGAFCLNLNTDVLARNLCGEFAFDKCSRLLLGERGGEVFSFDRDLDRVYFRFFGNEKGKVRARRHLDIICFSGEGRWVIGGHNDFNSGVNRVDRGTRLCPDSIAAAAGDHRNN